MPAQRPTQFALATFQVSSQLLCWRAAPCTLRINLLILTLTRSLKTFFRLSQSFLAPLALVLLVILKKQQTEQVYRSRFGL